MLLPHLFLTLSSFLLLHVLGTAPVHGCGRTSEDMIKSVHLRHMDGAEMRASPLSLPAHVISPLPSEIIRDQELPKYFDWRLVDGIKYATPSKTQNLPRMCGSCWAFSTVGALSDRYAIATKGRYPDLHLSPQALLDCAIEAGSCDGGSPLLAYKFIHQTPITDLSCIPYTGQDLSNWAEMDCSQRLCRNCDRFGTCSFMPEGSNPTFGVAEYGTVQGELPMMKEILARGPIACLLWAHSDSFENYKGGVITDTKKYGNGTITHAIVILGWGEEEDGTKFWIGRNSFGTWWGEAGFFRLIRGKNALNLEDHECAWGTPSIKSIEEWTKSQPIVPSSPSLAFPSLMPASGGVSKV